MFSKEFNSVYNAAFQSATGNEFESAAVQQEYQSYSDILVDTLLERWTHPDFDATSITNVQQAPDATILDIKHPLTDQYTENDAHDIAKVRFLGRKVLDIAQVSLAKNTNIDPKMDELSRFGAALWYENHPNVDSESCERVYGKDAASPLRLADWPKGEYLNCLGLSVASAAKCEETERPYFFLNSIRNNRIELAKVMPAYSARMMAGDSHRLFLEDALHQCVGEEEENDEKMRCLVEYRFAEKLHFYANYHEDQFHHAVTRLIPNIKTWDQFDPAAIKHGLLDRNAAISLDHKLAQNADATCNEITLLHSNRLTLLMQAISNGSLAADRSAARLSRHMQSTERISASKAYKQLHLATCAIIASMAMMGKNPIKHMPDSDLFSMKEGAERDITNFMWNIIAMSLAIDYAPQGSNFDPDFTKVVNRKDKNGIKLNDLCDPDFVQGAVQYVDQISRNNSSARKEFINLILAAPFSLAHHLAERKAFMYYALAPDMTLEVGDPAFQIGSMYLNHYAKCSKDVIVNIADELARINPSQLIWQSAASQAEGMASVHTSALGDVTKSLKLAQQHPLVRITPHR